MKYTLKNYVDSLFEGVPESMAAAELHDEILSNLEARYDDCINGGMSPQRAYAAVIGTMGDVSGLIMQVSESGMHTAGNYSDRTRLGGLLGKYSYVFTEENIRVMKKAAVLTGIIAAAAVITAMVYFDVKISLVIPFPVLFSLIIAAVLIYMAYNIGKFSREGDGGHSRSMILKTVKTALTILLWLFAGAWFFMVNVAGTGTFSVIIFFAAAIAQIIMNTVFRIQLSRYEERGL